MVAEAQNRVPSGLLTNEWADVPLARIVVWETLVLLFWGLVLGWRVRPRTMVGVAVLVAAALLVAVPLAWAKRRFGNPVFHNALARRLAVRTDQNASGVRVAYLLVALLATGAAMILLLFVIGGASSLLAREVPGLPLFLRRHFN